MTFSASNNAWIAAAIIIIALGFAHSYLGERYILIRLFRRTDLPALMGSELFTRRTLRFAWHLTTIAWWGIAALLLSAARSDSNGLAMDQAGTVIAVTSFVSGIVALVASRGRHLSWLFFFIVAILTWLGSH